MSCGVGRRRGSDPKLLWLWCRPAAVALIKPLAWEAPYAVGVALKKKKKTLAFEEKQVFIFGLPCDFLKAGICLNSSYGLTNDFPNFSI